LGARYAILCKKSDSEESLFGIFASLQGVDVTEVAALLSPILAITSWAVAQFSVTLQRKKLSDLLEKPFLIRHKAEILQADLAKIIQLGASMKRLAEEAILLIV
jgi:hypothetical protein